jgi:hypothetical protein
MFQLLKLGVILKWLILYIVFWIIEEIVLRLVISWIFGPKDKPSEPAKSIGSANV